MSENMCMQCVEQVLSQSNRMVQLDEARNWVYGSMCYLMNTNPDTTNWDAIKICHRIYQTLFDEAQALERLGFTRKEAMVQ